MTNGAYAKHLAPYIDGLPTATKNELLLHLALLVFPNGVVETPAALRAFYQGGRQRLAAVQPDEQVRLDRSSLTSALGEYVLECWVATLERSLPGHALDRLVGALPASGVRAALKRRVAEKAACPEAGR